MKEGHPIGIIETGADVAVFTVDDLVEEFFPEGKEISREDFLELRQTAYEVWQRQQKAGWKPENPEEELENSKRNWETATRILAIRKHIRRKDR